MKNLYQSPLPATSQLGGAATVAAASIQEDLMVSIQHSNLIHHPDNHDETLKATTPMFLSNIDQVLNFHVQTLHFFPPNPDYPPEAAAARLKTALQRLMQEPYGFLAGRFRTNRETGRLEVDCGVEAGVGFVVAASPYSLNQIGDLVYPNPAFAQLILPGLNQFDDDPLCVLQVTAFKCGGFALGLSTNHGLFDGLSFKMFLENLASQAFNDGRPIPVVPCHDRHLLAARSPPQVTFPHPELLKLKLPIGQEKPTTNADSKPEDLDFKVFRLGSDDISFLKNLATADGGAEPGTKITGFNVVTAHIWRCKALSVLPADEERESVVLYSVDVRSRLRPPLPASYCGNAVLTAYASAECRELRAGPFGRLVGLVSVGGVMMNDEYARSAIDWGELYKGFPHGEFLVSSWWRLGFEEAEYPWGRSLYSCPLVYRRKDIVLLFPELGGAASNGVNVLVALPPAEMEVFQSLFFQYLNK